jgi:hypothetical protein
MEGVEEGDTQVATIDSLVELNRTVTTELNRTMDTELNRTMDRELNQTMDTELNRTMDTAQGTSLTDNSLTDNNTEHRVTDTAEDNLIISQQTEGAIERFINITIINVRPFFIS